VHLVRTVTKGLDTLTKTLMETGLELNLRTDSENSGVTLVDYAMTIRVVGKLAVLGEAVMRAKVRDISRQTITSVQARVEKGYQGEDGR
jgi:carbon monoxide dehydrogenase subunit G